MNVSLTSGVGWRGWKLLGSARVVDVILLVALALGSLKTNVRLEQIVDIDPTDETQYLALGLGLPTQGPPDPAKEIFFAPLYSLWYLALAQVEPDPVQLPGLNFRIIGVLLPWIFYGMLRRGGCPPLAAAVAAFFLITHQLSLIPVTRSTHFAALCLAMGVWLALGAKTRVRQVSAVAFGGTLAAFVRPEYAPLAILLLLSAMGLFVVPRFREDRHDWRFPFGVFVLACVLVVAFGRPIGAGNDRSFLAFSQHFAKGYVARNSSDLNPWWDHDAIIGEVFEGSKTIGEALRKNPSAFFAHIAANVRSISKKLVPLGLSHRNFLLPEGHRWQLLERALLAALLLLLTVALRKRLAPNLRWLVQRQTVTLAFAICAAGLVLAGMVLTSTTDRYFFPVIFFSLFIGALLLGRAPDSNGSDEFPRRPLSVAAVGLALLGLAPASSYRDQEITSTRSIIAELSRHSFRDGTGFVEAVGMKSMEIYLSPQLRFVLPPEKETSLREFLETRRIGAIHLTPYLKGTRNFANDPEWHEFLAAPQSFGFMALPLQFQEILFLRPTALTNPPEPRL